MTDEELAQAKAAWQAAQPQAWEPSGVIHPAQLQVAAQYLPALLAEVERRRSQVRSEAWAESPQAQEAVERASRQYGELVTELEAWRAVGRQVAALEEDWIGLDDGGGRGYPGEAVEPLVERAGALLSRSTGETQP